MRKRLFSLELKFDNLHWNIQALFIAKQDKNFLTEMGPRFCGIWHILLRWKGSVYKLIWHEVLVFLLAYFAVSIIYRYESRNITI